MRCRAGNVGLRDEARSLLAKGINPHSERKRKRHAIVLAGEHTFMAVYEQWLAHRRLSLEEGRQTSLEQIGRVFKKDVFPSLRHLTIYEIMGCLAASPGTAHPG